MKPTNAPWLIISQSTRCVVMSQRTTRAFPLKGNVHNWLVSLTARYSEGFPGKIHNEDDQKIAKTQSRKDGGFKHELSHRQFGKIDVQFEEHVFISFQRGPSTTN